jgi:hypothetical protein
MRDNAGGQALQEANPSHPTFINSRDFNSYKIVKELRKINIDRDGDGLLSWWIWVAKFLVEMGG